MYQATQDLLAPKEWEPLSATGKPIDFTKLPIQSNFLFDMEHRFQAYGGGLGNGKSTALCLKVWFLSYLFPGNNGYFGRLDGKEFRNTTWREFMRLIPESFIAKKNDQLGYLRFKPQYGGSEIIYGDMKEDRFNNINLGFFAIDQAEEIDHVRWDLLVSRLRRQTPLIGDDDKPILAPNGEPLFAPTYGLAAFNPEGTSSYLWRYFHPDSPERKEGYQLYQASTYDGLAAGFIPQDYVDDMLKLFPPDARKRYLDGSWDVFSGRIFPTFSQDTHVLDYIRVQPHWKIYCSIDHGIKNPTAVGFWGVDEYGNRYLLDEHYEGEGQPVKYHAEVIKSKSKKYKQGVDLTYLDSACFADNQSRGGTVYSIADEYNSYGVYPIKGQKDWDSGYSRISQGLAIDPEHEHPETGEKGSPHIFIASHCAHFIKEALGYRWKKNRITAQLRNDPDEPIDFNDHHMDEWFYFEASRPSSPIITVKKRRNVLEEIRQARERYNPFAETKTGNGWMSW
jgi:hypothetical protein